VALKKASLSPLSEKEGERERERDAHSKAVYHSFIEKKAEEGGCVEEAAKAPMAMRPT